jgi:monofunctional biosynthetic peptidoglycan transglycosylase
LQTQQNTSAKKNVSIFRWIFRFILIAFFSSIIFTLIFRFVNPPFTPLMVIRSLEGMSNGEKIGINQEWVNLEDISPNLIKAVISAEDAKFFSHHGVDWEAVKKAKKRNEKLKGKKVYGASTISMQCARNVFLWQGRNYIRKALEVYFTFLIEFFWGKKRILEIYLNVIEWGNGVYGIESASQKYFKINSKFLSPSQSSLLAVVLPNPRKWSPSKPNNYVKKRAGKVRGGFQSVGLKSLQKIKMNNLK